MARFERFEVYKIIYEDRLIPLFYSEDKMQAQEVARALAAGGSRMLEFTNRGHGALEVFSHLIRNAPEYFPGLIIGAGTITDAYTASIFIENGADFIVGPNFDEATARLCNRKRIPYIPGAASINEILQAEEFGAELIKIFPGNTVGGPKFVEALKGPCPKTKVMPTGGVSVDEESIRAWFEAGVSCVGLGSQLISKKVLRENNYEEITEQTKKALDIIKKINVHTNCKKKN